MGFTWEMPPHHYLKRAWVLANVFGTSEEHEGRVAERVAGGFADLAAALQARHHDEAHRVDDGVGHDVREQVLPPRRTPSAPPPRRRTSAPAPSPHREMDQRKAASVTAPARSQLPDASASRSGEAAVERLLAPRPLRARPAASARAETPRSSRCRTRSPRDAERGKRSKRERRHDPHQQRREPETPGDRAPGEGPHADRGERPAAPSRSRCRRSAKSAQSRSAHGAAGRGSQQRPREGDAEGRSRSGARRAHVRA
jgi:hypothetical protein